MKTMRLWIIALMILVSLCGCSSNQEAPTSEVSATSSNMSENDSDISLSVGETTSELTTSETTSSEPTSSPEEKSTTQSTASQKGTEQPKTANSSSGNSSNQSENRQTTQSTASQKATETPTTTNSSSGNSSNPTTSKEQEKPASSKPEEKPKSAFSKPYDIGTMKSDLISYGTSIGMTHITKFSEDFGGGEITPTGTTWFPPVETWHYGSNSADKLKQDICYDIQNWKSKGESTYTLWFEKDSSHAGEYIIYVIIG